MLNHLYQQLLRSKEKVVYVANWQYTSVYCALTQLYHLNYAFVNICMQAPLSSAAPRWEETLSFKVYMQLYIP
jgi:cbb3-type cytochrome oxidase subunit 1